MEEGISLFQELDDKVKRICEASVEIFSRKRFSKATVSEIASTAGVGKGTVYIYFESKEELLHYLIEYGIQQLVDYVSNKIKKYTDPVKKLEEAIDAQLDFFKIHQEYFTFFLKEIWSYQEGLKEEITNLKENYISIFEDIINAGIKEGNLEKVNSKTISSGLFGFVSMSSVHWLLFAHDFPVKEIEQDIKKVFLKGILSS